MRGRRFPRGTAGSPASGLKGRSSAAGNADKTTAFRGETPARSRRTGAIRARRRRGAALAGHGLFGGPARGNRAWKGRRRGRRQLLPRAVLPLHRPRGTRSDPVNRRWRPGHPATAGGASVRRRCTRDPAPRGVLSLWSVRAVTTVFRWPRSEAWPAMRAGSATAVTAEWQAGAAFDVRQRCG